ncbi:hypothetical protein [Dietzia sp. PP-33]|uniref:hypothetical protein n=1 Tax=Dietzia sp. PP-33 TaxID=2957500 RepID=UPI0029A8442F|nr:hypothetical protein [Dietzia sp. PP-33]MDX2358315.1 hypothetical protein [Dietzia sp. PP-33]
MRILIADGDGAYRHSSGVLDEFVGDLAARLGAGPPVRVQWPEPEETRLRRPRTWDAAAAAGVADLARLVGLHPSDGIVLLGCCCGSRVVQDWMTAHPEQLDRVVAVGLIADPRRPRDRWLPGTVDPGGQGVAGRHAGPVPERTFWVSVPGDPLSGVERDSLLRTAVRDSPLTPDQVYRGLLEDLPESRTQLAARLHVLQHPSQWPTAFGRRLDEARETLVRYGDRSYAAQYSEPGPDGRSPLGVLGDRIVTAARQWRLAWPQDGPGRLAS